MKMNVRIVAAATLLLAAATGAQGASVEAFENATVQPGGVRSGSNGINFFNIEGAANNAFASYGVARFDLAAVKADFDAQYGAGGWRVTSVALELVQSNAAFSTSGGLDIQFTADDTISLIAGSSPLSHPFAGDFADATQITSFDYVVDATGVTNQVLLFADGAANTAGALALASDIKSDGLVTLALVERDDAVAATFAGYNNNAYAGPTLVITAAPVPEPETYALMLGGLGLLAAVARTRR